MRSCLEAMRRARELSENAEMFIVVGSSLQVQPAASFPILAKQGGAFLAIINRDPTPLDSVRGLVPKLGTRYAVSCGSLR